MVGSRGRRRLRAFPDEHGARVGLINELGETRNPRHDLQEEFQPFPAQIGVLCRQPRDVATRATEARDEPAAHRIRQLCHDDGDRAGRLLGRQARWRTRRNEDIDLEPDQLGGKTLDLVWFPLSKSGLQGDVLSFQVAQLM